MRTNIPLARDLLEAAIVSKPEQSRKLIRRALSLMTRQRKPLKSKNGKRP